MRTKTNIITEFLVRNGRSTSTTDLTDAIVNNWYLESHLWASAYHKWPFTEGRIQTTYTTTEEWSFDGYKADSFRILQIGGKRLTKLNFEDYQILKEETPDSTDRVFSDFGRTVFINTNIDCSGTLVAYGQYQPYIDITDESGITVFSDFDEEGNEAMVEKMSAYLKKRDQLYQESELHDQRASAKLEEVWKRTQDEQYAYQTTPERGGMFKRIDVLNGELTDNLFHRDQF